MRRRRILRRKIGGINEGEEGITEDLQVLPEATDGHPRGFPTIAELIEARQTGTLRRNPGGGVVRGLRRVERRTGTMRKATTIAGRGREEMKRIG